MKTRKLRKFLMLLASALLLVSVTVGATVAYLTAQTQVVTNTFTVGNVALTLDETIVDEYGVAITGEGAGVTISGNAYKLIPGHTYTKNPTVHIGATSEDGWLFVKVVNGIAAIEAEGNTTIAKQMETNWAVIDATKGIYAYKNVVTKSQNVPVFGSFTIAGNADVKDYTDDTITIQAYLVQADGFESDDTTPGYRKAWTAAPLSAWN